MTRTIYLQGRMGKMFGKEWRLNCKTVQEAMHAIDCMKGGVRKYLSDCTENGVGFTVQKGEEFLDNQTVGLELGKDDIIITPVPAGSGKGSSWVKIIVGALLIAWGVMSGDPTKAREGWQLMAISMGTQLALQGIVELLTPEPDELDESESTLFQGPINNTKSGVPVPLAYGKIEVGGAVVNFGFTQSRLRGNAGYTFVGKGTSSGSGYGSGGGGGGGNPGRDEYNLAEQE